MLTIKDDNLYPRLGFLERFSTLTLEHLTIESNSSIPFLSESLVLLRFTHSNFKFPCLKTYDNFSKQKKLNELEERSNSLNLVFGNISINFSHAESVAHILSNFNILRVFTSFIKSISNLRQPSLKN